MRERAALAFTENVTLMADTHLPAEAYDAPAAEFSPDEIAAMVALIVAINAWNAVGVSTRTWEPAPTSPDPPHTGSPFCDHVFEALSVALSHQKHPVVEGLK